MSAFPPGNGGGSIGTEGLSLAARRIPKGVVPRGRRVALATKSPAMPVTAASCHAMSASALEAVTSPSRTESFSGVSLAPRMRHNSISMADMPSLFLLLVVSNRWSSSSER